MSQSLSKVLVHLIFSTKNRSAFLPNPEFRRRTHAYIARVLNELDSPAIEVGGGVDHAHALFNLSRNHAISEIVRRAKANSSGWVKTQGCMLSKFEWQAGYCTLSVDPSQLEQVRRYIREQEEHHRVRTFQEEYLKILGDCRVPYDPTYLWT
jgi:putative transposase